jgi:hypothetical protein
LLYRLIISVIERFLNLVIYNNPTMISLIIVGIILISTVAVVGGVLMYSSNKTNPTVGEINCETLYNKASISNDTGLYIGDARTEKCYCSKKAKIVDGTCVEKLCSDYNNYSNDTTDNSFDVYGKKCYCRDGYRYDASSDNCISSTGDTDTTPVPSITTGGVSSTITANKFTSPDGQTGYCLNGYKYNAINNKCIFKETGDYDNLNKTPTAVANPVALPDGSTLHCMTGYKYDTAKDNCVIKAVGDYSTSTTFYTVNPIPRIPGEPQYYCNAGSKYDAASDNCIFKSRDDYLNSADFSGNKFILDGVTRYCKNGYMYDLAGDICFSKNIYSYNQFATTDATNNSIPKNPDRPIYYCRNGYIYDETSDNCIAKSIGNNYVSATTTLTANSIPRNPENPQYYCINGYKYDSPRDNCVMKTRSDYSYLYPEGFIDLYSDDLLTENTNFYCNRMANNAYYSASDDNCVIR